MGEAHFWNSDWASAIEAFEESIDFEYPKPELAHRGIGWSQFNLGNYNLARLSFERAVEFNPDIAYAYNGLGWVWIRQGQCEKATPPFVKALELTPDLIEAQRGLQECGLFTE